MNSRHIAGCQNISANVNQLDPEHQQCHTHYKRQKHNHLLENEREREYFPSTKDFNKKHIYNIKAHILHILMPIG